MSTLRRTYETLQLQTEEVTRKRDQLKSDLSALQQQVAYLMAEQEKEKAVLKAPTAEEEVVEDRVLRVGSYMEIHGKWMGSYMEIHGNPWKLYLGTLQMMLF
uniref:Uncharacterized protein n=1 Tax=Sphaerodactylus townsendi TaxID=933632 RepID=A0ACB8E6B4_9SAUR